LVLLGNEPFGSRPGRGARMFAPIQQPSPGEVPEDPTDPYETTPGIKRAVTATDAAARARMLMTD